MSLEQNCLLTKILEIFAYCVACWVLSNAVYYKQHTINNMTVTLMPFHLEKHQP